MSQTLREKADGEYLPCFSDKAVARVSKGAQAPRFEDKRQFLGDWLMETTQPKKPQEQQPYSEPTLIEYGSVRELTKAVGGTGNPDGGGAPRSKTHV